MSLKKQIETRSSVVGGFLREIFPSNLNRSLLAEIHSILRNHEPIRVLGENTPPWVFTIVGHAIDYRIRYHFENTDFDQFTMAREGIWAVTRIDDLAHALETDPLRFPDYMKTAFGDTPEPDEDWDHFLDTEDGFHTIWRKPNAKPGIPASSFSMLLHASGENPDRIRLPLDCTLEFIELLHRSTRSIAAHIRQPTDDEERTLACICLVLSVFESFRRSGGRGWPPSFYNGSLPQDASGLLDMIPDSWVRDVTELTKGFVDSHADWHGKPATLNPVLAGSRYVGGADADIVIDGCLWEIKTTFLRKAPGKWFYQLLGYVLLDFDDALSIDHAGLLFPRQGAEISWPLSRLIQELSGKGDLSLPEIRRELHRRLMGLKPGHANQTVNPPHDKCCK